MSVRHPAIAAGEFVVQEPYPGMKARRVWRCVAIDAREMLGLGPEAVARTVGLVRAGLVDPLSTTSTTERIQDGDGRHTWYRQVAFILN